ncbi:LysR substrate-binding domain-containing protein [Rhodococcus sp. G-MC3]|uniref:LysR family transcriptional regulator n=1 Tax=Rhodococcus sp. G-MC3 TaxID=3046209 RepID=UPI0024BAB07C|nr:LysR family transcriptional regulator [Rhodococcus sp. G-MC3]MDJ0395056.1 LysR substrate-binding domain-containing protein [Rhodococcus sp. G-MC3]
MSINIGIAHLRAIVALTDHGSFTAAAGALDVSQPSLSRTVAEAERRLKVRLFVRTTRSVTPTGDGREVASFARRVLFEFDEGLRQIGRFVSGERGTVTIACLPSLAATYLPQYIVDFRSQHPEVTVHIQDGLRDDVLSAVRDGSVDFALAAAAEREDGLDAEPVTRDLFVCAVPSDHRFVGRDSVDWTELAGESFIAFGPESSIDGPVRRALDNAGVHVGPVVRAHNVGAVAGLTAAGLGITVVPELVVPMMSFAPLTYVPLEPKAYRTISVVQLPRRHHSASSRAFIEMLLPRKDRETTLP